MAALGRLDAALGQAPGAPSPGRAFAAAMSAARDSSQWLSLAKRAPAAEARGDKGRTLAVASGALKAFPANETVATAAAWLYLRGGEPQRALALFPRPLDPEARLGLWAEARLRLAGSRPLLDPEECGRLARATGRASWYFSAALLSMRAGDRFTAQAWLREALRGGFDTGYLPLWDAGLPGELLARLGPGASAEELALGAYAAWSLGQRERARDLWRASLSLSPRPSWRSEAALAILAPRGDEALGAARGLAAAFPKEPEALRFSAALLLREGREAEAGGLAPRLQGSGAFLPRALGLELEAPREGEERFLARVTRLPEEYPTVPEARAFALRTLFAHGRWNEYLVLYDEGSAADKGGPDWWFWSLGAELLRGDLVSASSAAEAGASPTAAPGPEGAFAQGLLAVLRGDSALAKERFQAALGLAEQDHQRAAILKELGRLSAAEGRRSEALATWAAALAADPGDAEAAILAAGGGGQ